MKWGRRHCRWGIRTRPCLNLHSLNSWQTEDCILRRSLTGFRLINFSAGQRHFQLNLLWLLSNVPKVKLSVPIMKSLGYELSFCFLEHHTLWIKCYNYNDDLTSSRLFSFPTCQRQLSLDCWSLFNWSLVAFLNGVLYLEMPIMSSQYSSDTQEDHICALTEPWVSLEQWIPPHPEWVGCHYCAPKQKETLTWRIRKRLWSKSMPCAWNLMRGHWSSSPIRWIDMWLLLKCCVMCWCF